MKTLEILELLYVGISNMLYNLALFIHEIFCFGKNQWWWALRFEFLKNYRLARITAIVKNEATTQKYPSDNFIYGETPAATVEKIINTAGAGPGDLFIDMGSGRGLAVFYANLIAGMKAHGYELLPTFCKKAQSIRKKLKIDGVRFFNRDLLEAGISSAKVIYIAGTTFDDAFIEKLNGKLRQAPPGAVIVTLSYGLSKKYFNLFEEQILPFSWGKSHVYYHRRRDRRTSPRRNLQTTEDNETDCAVI